MFDSIEDISALSTTFTRSLTLKSQELLDGNIEAGSSLDLDVDEMYDTSLSIFALQT